jgi:hypothetical protein
LSEVTKAFELAWSPFPDRLMGMAHRRQRKGSPATLDVTVGKHDASLVLSEGQAGVKALSFLLAASTAYPWSRWRALLREHVKVWEMIRPPPQRPGVGYH